MQGQEPGQIVVPAIPHDGLVGRSAELAAVQRTLGRARLVTVTGLPGVGKTAVAVAAAAAMHNSFADGAWLVPLGSVPDESHLPDAIAGALGVPDGGARDPIAALVDELRDRRLLLVLDTCEHLAGACADFVTKLLLMPGRDVRILATSREALRAPGGLSVTIRPLPLRFAVTLFARRAAEVEPDFRITPENRAAVQEICLLLDRLPLAIELAARQVADGSLDQLYSRLKDDFWFLRNAEAVPARHASLRAAIGWSYQLCTPAERRLWARLSVFTGSFGLRDAQDVCADAELHEQAIDTAVTMLVARSVLLTELQTGRQVRYRLPTTLRAYGAAELRRCGEEQWEQRYLAWDADRQSRHWYTDEGR